MAWCHGSPTRTWRTYCNEKEFGIAGGTFGAVLFVLLTKLFLVIDHAHSRIRISKVRYRWFTVNCRLGKSVTWIRNVWKMMGSEDWLLEYLLFRIELLGSCLLRQKVEDSWKREQLTSRSRSA